MGSLNNPSCGESDFRPLLPRSRDVAVRGGVQIPVNDPSLLIPAMAHATEHLGFAYTSSVLQSHPFTFARQISTLDHLTKGRVAWNIVASYLEGSGRNFRRTGLLDHDERIEEALRSLRGEPRDRELGTLNCYLWAFVVGEVIVNVPRSL